MLTTEVRIVKEKTIISYHYFNHIDVKAIHRRQHHDCDAIPRSRSIHSIHALSVDGERVGVVLCPLH